MAVTKYDRSSGISISINANDGVEKLRKLYEGILNDQQFNRALALGLNDMMRQVRTMVGREIRELYNIRAGYLTGKFININPAFVSKGGQKTKLFTTMSFSPNPIPMGEFIKKTVNGNKGRGKLLTATGKRRHVANMKGQMGIVADQSGSGGIIIEVLKGHQEFVPSAFIAHSSGMVVARSNIVGNKSYNLGPNKAFNFRDKRVPGNRSDTPIGALFTASPFTGATNKIVQQGVYDFVASKMDRIILSKLDAMANGWIRESKWDNVSSRSRAYNGRWQK